MSTRYSECFCVLPIPWPCLLLILEEKHTENSQFTLTEEHHPFPQKIHNSHLRKKKQRKKEPPSTTHTQNSHLQKKKKKTLPTPNPKRTPSPISKRSTVRVCSTDPFIGIDELRWFDVVVWLQPGPGLETHELQTCTQALHTSTMQENSSTPYYDIVIYPTKRQITRVNNRKRFSQL